MVRQFLGVEYPVAERLVTRMVYGASRDGVYPVEYPVAECLVTRR